MTITLPAPSELRPGRTLTSDHLLEVVRRVAADRALWTPLVADDDRITPGMPPHRVPLRQHLGCEVWVLTWPTSWGTRLHSHERSDSAFAAVRGTITEVRLDELGRLLPRSFRDGLAQLVPAGQAHDLRNERPEPAVTVHAYPVPPGSSRPHPWVPRGGRARAFVPPTVQIPAW